VARPDPESVLVPFRDNVTITCGSAGRQLRATASSGFRQCVYDPKPGLPDYWLSGMQPSCPRVDCYSPMPTPGAEYGQFVVRSDHHRVPEHQWLLPLPMQIRIYGHN